MRGVCRGGPLDGKLVQHEHAEFRISIPVMVNSLRDVRVLGPEEPFGPHQYRYRWTANEWKYEG